MSDDAAPVTAPKAEPIPAAAPIQIIQARATPNPRWSTRHRNKLFTVPIKPLLGPDDNVFTMGSCFAERIRAVLTDEGIRVGPRLAEIPVDRASYRIDNLPTREHMNYYNTFTIRQEFERHLGEWRQDPEDYWTIPKAHPEWGGTEYYQDPYRRSLFARSPDALRTAVRHVDKAMDEGMRRASVFFLTLGLTEVFRNRASGKIACQIPGHAGGAGGEETEFHASTYEENLANMEKIVEMITTIRPDARIVVTVSPVSLSRTFGPHDITVANTESKSILRVVLGALARKHPNVTYFPAYELVMANSPFSFREDDGLHVANWIVYRIVTALKAAHYQKDQEPEAATQPKVALSA